VDGFPVHAVIVDSKIIRHESGADNDHRVDGSAVHPTDKKSPCGIAAGKGYLQAARCSFDNYSL
jgi:hypothetical protein